MKLHHDYVKVGEKWPVPDHITARHIESEVDPRGWTVLHVWWLEDEE